MKAIETTNSSFSNFRQQLARQVRWKLNCRICIEDITGDVEDSIKNILYNVLKEELR